MAPAGLGRAEGLEDPGDREAVRLERGRVGCGLEAAAVGWGRVAGAVEGLYVATESIAPATRQTAKMLASSGRIVPCPPKGDTSRRSLRRLRRARSSRW